MSATVRAVSKGDIGEWRGPPPLLGRGVGIRVREDGCVEGEIRPDGVESGSLSAMELQTQVTAKPSARSSFLARSISARAASKLSVGRAARRPKREGYFATSGAP
jgi:hypothetical protein